MATPQFEHRARGLALVLLGVAATVAYVLFAPDWLLRADRMKRLGLVFPFVIAAYGAHMLILARPPLSLKSEGARHVGTSDVLFWVVVMLGFLGLDAVLDPLLK